jgi:uncharacterized protein YraI
VAEHRHKRDTDARRLFGALTRTFTTTGPVSGGLAALATTAVVTAGVLNAPLDTDLLAADAAGAAGDVRATASPSADVRDRIVVSRSSSRRDNKEAVKEARADGALAATAKAVRRADTRLWTTAPLNLWTASGEDAVQVGEIPASRHVLVTGRQAGDREEIVVGGKSRWVTAGYLDDEKPVAFGGACTNGTSVSSGVSASIVKVHQAVCAAFPSITVYGTLRGGGGDHGIGRAVDIMVSGELGWQVADFVREHYAELGVSYVIYSQNIWSVERGGEGWRGMSDRGSVTANHYDHVHVSVF